MKFKTYVNASFIYPTLGYRSASGYLAALGGGPIVYGSKLQKVTAENTCETELLAMSTITQSGPVKGRDTSR